MSNHHNHTYKIVGAFKKSKPMSPEDKAYYDELCLMVRQLMKKGQTRYVHETLASVYNDLQK